MAPENMQNTPGDLKQETSALHDVASKDDATAPPQEPQQTTQNPQQATKESYDDYIKNLPPPFWATNKKTPPQPRAASSSAAAASSSSEATASAAAARARIAAVNAPVTAEQRAEDERLKAMSWLERWRERKERRRRQEDRDPDLRPVERGSRAQLNVFGSNVREKKRR